MTFIRVTKLLLSGLTFSFSCIGCGGGGSSSSTEIELRFSPKINGVPFACGKAFSGVGSTLATVSPIDLRFYVSNIRLVDSTGAELPLNLLQDGRWQYQDVAKLDFEDGSGSCSEGDPEVNTIVRGSVSQGDYVGLRFTLGIPFDLDHIDASTAPAPLNDSAMFWNWTFGYKFLKFDFSSPGLPDGFRVHIGSTECDSVALRLQQLLHSDHAGTVASCGHPNTVEVSIPDFDPTSHAVGMDLGSLVSGVNVNQNVPQTAPGCMSEQNDPDCIPIFQKLGLTLGETPAGVEKLFYRE